MRATEIKTVDDLKRWAKDSRRLAECVCLAQAFAECERERVTAYTRPIFDRYTFYADDDGENGKRITDQDRLYLSKDDDLCAQYYAELDVAHRAHGFDGPAGHCPALVAEDMLRQAENALLESLASVTGVDSYNRSLDMRAKALDLALSACLSA